MQTHLTGQFKQMKLELIFKIVQFKGYEFLYFSSEVAKHLNKDSYGLIFGVNTFIALILQTILTMAVADEGGLAFTIRDQVSSKEILIKLCFSSSCTECSPSQRRAQRGSTGVVALPLYLLCAHLWCYCNHQ